MPAFICHENQWKSTMAMKGGYIPLESDPEKLTEDLNKALFREPNEEFYEGKIDALKSELRTFIDSLDGPSMHSASRRVQGIAERLLALHEGCLSFYPPGTLSGGRPENYKIFILIDNGEEILVGSEEDVAREFWDRLWKNRSVMVMRHGRPLFDIGDLEYSAINISSLMSRLRFQFTVLEKVSGKEVISASLQGQESIFFVFKKAIALDPSLHTFITTYTNAQ